MYTIEDTSQYTIQMCPQQYTWVQEPMDGNQELTIKLTTILNNEFGNCVSFCLHLDLSGSRGPVYKIDNTSITINNKIPVIFSRQPLPGQFVFLLLVDQQIKKIVPILVLIIDPDDHEEVGLSLHNGGRVESGNQLIYLGHHLVILCSVLTMSEQI